MPPKVSNTFNKEQPEPQETQGDAKQEETHTHKPSSEQKI